MLYTAATFKLVFDYQPDDIYWCTADIGWITGHSYITYGPLANGATSVLVSAARGAVDYFHFLSLNLAGGRSIVMDGSWFLICLQQKEYWPTESFIFIVSCMERWFHVWIWSTPVS